MLLGNSYKYLNSSVEDYGTVNKEKLDRSLSDYLFFYLEILGNTKQGPSHVQLKKILYCVPTTGLQRALNVLKKPQGKHFCSTSLNKSPISVEMLFRPGDDGKLIKSALAISARKRENAVLKI